MCLGQHKIEVLHPRLRNLVLKPKLFTDSKQGTSAIVTNRASLERILAELLNNACKHTPDDGEIVLSVE